MARAEGSAQALRREDMSKVHLGRKPFVASIRYYEAYQEGRLSKSTMKVDLRRLKRFAAFFEGLAESGVCGTTDPRRMDEATVNEFLIWMRSEGLKESTAEGYVKILNRMLNLFGNPVIDEMRKKPWQYRFPKAPRDT
ncbi:MAG: phage integrase SAM-like domain-containing protein, partial [Candidatus Methanomethylophilaceae archaeon]|nr:phage integrase SAM-like domain-containing protein [Candidatus Methanomethylophilaceae archaeon]